jgi:hypothetical protein
MIVWRFLKGFVRFWIGYIFGDDWTVAVVIAIGLVATWRLVDAHINAWWLLPPVVIAAAVQSLYRAVGRERRPDVTQAGGPAVEAPQGLETPLRGRGARQRV